MAEILLADTETTGLTDRDGIVEFAFLHLNESAEVLTEYSARVNPGVPVSAEASAKNGITDAMLAGCPSMPSVLMDSRAGGRTPTFENVMLIAHNAQFDRKFLSPFWGVTSELCTLRAARQLFPGAPDHQLQTLGGYLRLPSASECSENAHNALYDARLTYELLLYILEETGLPLLAVQKELLQPQAYQTMPWGKHKGLPISQIPKGYLRWIKENVEDPYEDWAATWREHNV
jgi:exodeoxyribonuclease X